MHYNKFMNMLRVGTGFAAFCLVGVLYGQSVGVVQATHSQQIRELENQQAKQDSSLLALAQGQSDLKADLAQERGVIMGIGGLVGLLQAAQLIGTMAAGRRRA